MARFDPASRVDPTSRASRLAGIVLLVLGLAACGGGGGGGEGGGGPNPPPDPGPLNGPDVRLSTDTPGAALSLVPDVCCEGDAIYVVWYDLRSGALDIHFNRSLDRGVTWLAQDVRLDTDAAGAAGSLVPRICCDGNAVYVVWYDERGGSADIYFNRSLDRGTTWLPSDVRLSTDTAGAASARDPRIVCQGSTVTVCWVDRRDGGAALRANVSTDAGTTWLRDDVRIDRAAAGAGAVTAPRMVRSGAWVHAIWQDGRGGGSDIYISRTGDGGASWLAADVRLNEPGQPSGDATSPDLAVAGSHLLAVWRDTRSGLGDIHANRSLDDGVTWLPADVRIDRGAAGAADALAPRVVLAGGRGAVTWEDHRAGRADVYFSASADGGATWDAEDRAVDAAPAALAAALRPRIRASAGGHLHILWRDEADGRFDVRLRRSVDGGATWTDAPLRLDTDEPGADHSLDPTFCFRGETAYVVWSDLRHGPGDIYFNAASFDP